MTNSLRFVLVFSFFSFVFVTHFAAAADVAAQGWDASLYLRSHGNVTAVAVFDGELYAAGELHQESHGRFSFGRWDGQSWQPVPGGPKEGVLALLPFKNSLMVASKPSRDNRGNYQCVWAWSGSTWKPVGNGIRGEIHTMVEYRGDLIAGGRFKGSKKPGITNLARWDGNQWLPLGPELSGGGHAAVHALTVHGDRLFVGGVFAKAGDLLVHNIAAWDGTNWAALGEGADDPVLALTEFRNQVVAGGRFKKMDGVAHLGVARWDGTQWLGLSGGMPLAMPRRLGQGFEVRALSTIAGELAVGGCYPHDDTLESGLLSIWNGVKWRIANPPLDYAGIKQKRAKVSCLVEYDGGLVAGGTLASADSKEIGAIAILKGERWTSLGSGRGLRSEIHSLFVFRDRPLAWHGTKSGTSLSFWTGHDWESLNRRTTPTGRLLKGIYAVACRNDELIVFGSFEAPGKKSLRCYARYNDGWCPLGEFWSDAKISAQHMVFQGTDLVVTEARPAHRNLPRVRVWNGVSWKTLAGGSQFHQVEALQSDGKRLFIAAQSTDRLKHGRMISAWDGIKWTKILEWPDRREKVVMGIHNGMLHAGFSRITPDEPTLESVMRWDGKTWTQVGGRLGGPNMRNRAGALISGQIKDFATYQGHLIVTGTFTHTGEEPTPSLTWHDGDQWRPWQGSLQRGTALLALDDCLWVGGDSYDGSLASSINRWDGPIPVQFQVSKMVVRRGTPPKKPQIEESAEGITARAVESLEQLLSALEESYPRLDRLGEGWPMLAKKFRRDVYAVDDEKSYDRLVGDLIQRMNDRAIRFKPKRRPFFQRSKVKPSSYVLSQLRNYERQRGWIGDDICYLLANQSGSYPNGQAWNEITSSAGGIILDLRIKSGTGGYTWREKEEELLAFVGRMTGVDLSYGTVRRRVSKTSTNLTEPDTLTIHPKISRSHHAMRLPLVCLIDHSVNGQLVELALILKALPGARIVGQTTKGMLGPFRTIDMDLGGKAFIPLERKYDLNGQEVLVGQGIQPDVIVQDNHGSRIFDVGVEVLRTMMQEWPR